MEILGRFDQEFEVTMYVEPFSMQIKFVVNWLGIGRFKNTYYDLRLIIRQEPCMLEDLLAVLKIIFEKLRLFVGSRYVNQVKYISIWNFVINRSICFDIHQLTSGNGSRKTKGISTYVMKSRKFLELKIQKVGIT